MNILPVIPKETGVVYLLADRLQIYVTSLPTVLECRFEDSVNNLNLINKQLFERTITNFISINNITTSSLIIVIGDNASQIKTATDQTKVTFEHHISKIISTSRGTKIFTVNQEIYSTIKEIFERQGFIVDFVLPAIVFGDDFGTIPDLTFERAGIIFQKAFEQEKYNLISSRVSSTQEEELEQKIQKKHDILGLYAMMSVFGVLIIAVTVMWNIYNPGPQDRQGRAGQATIIMPNKQETKNLSVKIVGSSKTSKLATQIKEALVKYQFKSINTENKSLATEHEITVLFSPKASPTVHGAVLTEAQKLSSDVFAEESTSAVYDIIILLGE